MQERRQVVTSIRPDTRAADDGAVLRLVRSSIRLDPPEVRFVSANRRRATLPLFAAQAS